MLGKAVIVANYATAKSQVMDGIDGVIVPQENGACADAIAKVITDRKQKKRIEDYLHTHNYGNESEIQKFYKLMV